jgi:hypothetical protein
MLRTLALWLLLFGAYAATLGIPAVRGQDYAGDEPHYLLSAESIVSDGDVDLRDEYAFRDYERFHDGTLARHGKLTEGRLNEPHGFGFPLLIAPAYAIAGPVGVELFLAALIALGAAAAYRLARRVTPDPWALGATAVAGLSPPFLAYGTAIYPELPAGAILAGGALLAMRLDARPSRRLAFPCFALLGCLPWLSPKFLPAALIVGYVAARGMWRARRRTLTIGAVELALFGLALLVALNEALYGGPTPYSAGSTATGVDAPGDLLDRAYRLVALFVDRDVGLLRWAPFVALAFAGLWWLWRSRRDHLARAVAGVRDVELTAELCAGVLGAQLLVAAFLTPTLVDQGFPGRQLLVALPLAIPLCAWGYRHAARTGTALALLTLTASVWLYVEARTGGSLVGDRPDAPFGPLTDLLPPFTGDSDWPYWLAGAIAAALAALVLREARGVRDRPALGARR